MFTTPVIRPIKPFDATEDFLIEFEVQSGPQVQKHEIIITDNVTNIIMYQVTINNLILKHQLPANTLINDNEYRIKIRVNDGGTVWSDFSEEVIVYTLLPPTIVFTNIDELNRVQNQTETFTATYTHPNDEPLQSYRFIVYNNNQALLESFDEQFGTGEGVLQQEVAGLLNGENYYIELRTLSQKGQEASSGLVLFIPFYLVPRLFTTLTAESDFARGAIKLSANILQIIMKVYDYSEQEVDSQTIVYPDNTQLNMNDSNYAKLVAEEGFGINGQDFMLQLWAKNLNIGEDLLTLFSPFGELTVRVENNYLLVTKTQLGTNLKAQFRSIDFPIDYSFTNSIIINVRSKYGLIDITYTIL